MANPDTQTGVLLVNLGTPASYQVKDVKTYLKEFLLDPYVMDLPWLQRNLLVRGIIIPSRASRSAAMYQKIWTKEGSPLLIYSQRLTNKVQDTMGDDYKVVLAMRYKDPGIREGLEQLKESDQIIVVPLFPQYADSTTGSIISKVNQIIKKWKKIPRIKFIKSYCDHPEMIAAFSELGKNQEPEKWDHVLFSFHGLPERQILKADQHNICLKDGCCDNIGDNNALCYRAQCFATAYAIVDKLAFKQSDYTISFQSKLGKGEWLKPYTNETLVNLAQSGAKRLLVLCPAFVCDCLETIYEIGIEEKENFKKAGGEQLQLVEGLNDHPLWVNALKDIITSSIS